MSPGSVLFYRGFQFEDGGISDKLMVIISKDRDNKNLFLLTTSRQKNRLLQDGCHPGGADPFFTFNNHLDGFDKTTWVLLNPRTINTAELLNRKANGEVGFIFRLREMNLRALINCLKRCDDVSPYHLSFLS